MMTTGATKKDDERLVALAEAEREAGVPDQQTAIAAAEAKKRLDEQGTENSSIAKVARNEG